MHTGCACWATAAHECASSAQQLLLLLPPVWQHCCLLLPPPGPLLPATRLMGPLCDGGKDQQRGDSCGWAVRCWLCHGRGSGW